MNTFWAVTLVSGALLFIVLAFVTINRYIRYKERVALAQLGFSLEDLNHDLMAKKHGSRGVLWGGVITAMSGLALLLGLSTLGIGAWLIGGLLPLFVGLGMVLIYYMTSGPTQNSPNRRETESQESANLEAQDADDMLCTTKNTIPLDAPLGDHEPQERQSQ